MKSINKKLKRFSALAIFASAAALPISANAVCVIDGATPRAILSNQIKLSEQSVMTALSGMDKAVSTAMEFQTAAIQAAVNTLSTQKATAALQIGEAINNNAQIQTTAIQQIETAQKAKDVLIDYGPSSAGHQVCKVVAQRHQIGIADSDADKAVPQMISAEVTARPGGYASRGSAMATRLALHDKLYCTESQASSGLCSTEGPRAGKSLAAATMFIPADYDSPEYRDKSAFINNMVGLPDNPLTQVSAATIQGQSYSDLKRRKDAIISTATNSLKTIQADWSATASHHVDEHGSVNEVVALSEKQQLADADNMPVATSLPQSEQQKTLERIPVALQIKNDVNRYLGSGQEYKDWSKTLVGASERGVLQEVLRVKALRLYLQSKQYEQLSRMEAMLAANVSAETYRTGMEDNIDRQRQVIMRKNIAASID